MYIQVITCIYIMHIAMNDYFIKVKEDRFVG